MSIGGEENNWELMIIALLQPFNRGIDAPPMNVHDVPTVLGGTWDPFRSMLDDKQTDI